jgi:hypothetical protein
MTELLRAAMIELLEADDCRIRQAREDRLRGVVERLDPARSARMVQAVLSTRSHCRRRRS